NSNGSAVEPARSLAMHGDRNCDSGPIRAGGGQPDSCSNCSVGGAVPVDGAVDRCGWCDAAAVEAESVDADADRCGWFEFAAARAESVAADAGRCGQPCSVVAVEVGSVD